MAAKTKPHGELPERVALAQIKLHFSRYVREVQMRGHVVTITQHGRPAALLTPLATSPQPAIKVREPVDPRPLGALNLRPRAGRGASSRAILRAIDDERGE